MDISVIVCTYNRSANLVECFEHLSRQQDLHGLEWEVVLVDNNSTDDTKHVTQSLNDTLPMTIHYEHEKTQGLSYARNRGIEKTTSRYVAFIDDDIHASPGWLHAIYSAFAGERCDSVGGPILIDAPDRFPRWIKPDMYGFLGYRNFGDSGYQMDGFKQFPFGGNMAFDRRVFSKIGLFNTSLGRKGSGHKRDELFKGEETDFFHRLTRAGGTIYYEPSAKVHHQVLPHQLTKRFFRVIHYNAGYIKALHDKSLYRRRFLGIPLFIYSQTMAASRRYLAESFRKGPSNTFRLQMNIAYFVGMMRGYADGFKNLKAE